MRSVTDTATLRELTEKIIAKADIRVTECRLNLRDDADSLPEEEKMAMLHDLRKIGFMAGNLSLCGTALLSRDERTAICVSGCVLFNSAGYKGYFDLPRLMLFCAPRKAVLPDTEISGEDILTAMKNSCWKKIFDSFRHSGRAFPDYRVIRDLSLKFTDDPAVTEQARKVLDLLRLASSLNA